MFLNSICTLGLKTQVNLNQDIDRVSQNVEELRALQGKVLKNVVRDEAVDAKMDDLNAENKRLGKKIRNVLRADQDRMEALKKRSPSKMSATERAEMQMRQTQLNSQSRVSETRQTVNL